MFCCKDLPSTTWSYRNGSVFWAVPVPRITLMLSSFAKGVPPPARLSACITVSCGIHDVHAGLVDLPDHVDAVAGNVFDHDGDDGFRDVLLELALDVHANLVRTAACRLYFAGQRK